MAEVLAQCSREPFAPPESPDGPEPPNYRKIYMFLGELFQETNVPMTQLSTEGTKRCRTRLTVLVERKIVAHLVRVF